MRSFSNLWFWIALAVMWSTVNHWVLGVPWDMITRAKRNPEPMIQDVEDLVRININRMMFITQTSGLLMVGFISFLLTGLFLLGFIYGREFAQAVFLLALPLSIVWGLSLRRARIIRGRGLSGAALLDQLARHRLSTQLVGMLAILVTAVWGMLQNLSVSALGG